MAKCLQYGCGLTAPKEWLNYDASQMVRIRKVPIIGKLIEKKRGVFFPENVMYGDIIKGFHKHNLSCDAVYCSHVLEHLTFDEMPIALENTYALLKDGGVFRMVMPDLAVLCESYCSTEPDQDRSIIFMKNTGLGYEGVRKGLLHRIQAVFGNSRHCWLWDYDSIIPLLFQVGFTSVRSCEYNDSSIKEFIQVEDINRFKNAIAVEAIK